MILQTKDLDEQGTLNVIDRMKFPVIFNKQKRDKKPDGKEIGMIQNQFKQAHETETLTLEEILSRATQGQTWYAGEFKIKYTQQELREIYETAKEDYNEAELKKAQLLSRKKLQFNRTRLLVLDIDDDFGEYNPKEVYDFVQGQALYYTFSHGIYISELGTKQHAYRIILTLDQEVNTFELLQHIGNHYKQMLENQFPMLKTKVVDGTNRSEVEPIYRIILGTNNKTYYLNKEREPVDVEKHNKQYQLENAIRLYSGGVKKKLEQNYYRPETPTDQEILEIAKHLGDTSHLLTLEEWASMAIGIFYNAQMGDYSEETALEAIKVTDSNQQPDSYYLSLKRPVDFKGVPRTVATFIKLAIEQGYKLSKTSRYANHEEIKAPDIPTERIEFEKYIHPQDMLEVILNPMRKTLLVAPTNSGKTYSAVNASKQFVEQNKKQFVYIATPTKLLGGQVASTYELGKPIQDNINVRATIQKGLRNGLFVRVGTYDKIEHVINQLPNDYEITILVDEAHQEITAYNYRYKAIRKLFELANHERVRKFIGLTATPEPINLSNYDNLVKAESIEPRAVAESLQVLSYQSASINILESVLARTIAHEFRANGNKVLAFINKKELGEKIQRVLKKQGLRVAIVNSETAQSNTFNKIVKDEVFPENIDVIIATVALSDGVNIKNESENFTTVIATHYIHSQLYDLSTIKQIANRFRKKYKKVIVPVFFKRDLEDDRFTTKPFNLDAEHNLLMTHSQVQAQATKEVFEDDITLYRPSFVENINGLFSVPDTFDVSMYQAGYQAHARREKGQRLTDEEERSLSRMKEMQKELFTVDERYIRSIAVRNQAKYYAFFPYAFVDQLAKMIEVEEVEEIQLVQDFLSNEDTDDKNDIVNELQRLTEIAKLENQEKLERVNEIVSETVFSEAQQHYLINNKIDQSIEIWQTLKKAMHPAQYASLRNLIKFMDHDQALKELERVGGQPKKANELYNTLKALNVLKHHKKASEAGKPHNTYITYLDLLEELPTGYITVDETDEYLKEVVRKRKGRRLKETKATFESFFIKDTTRTYDDTGRRVRVRSLQPVSLDYVKSKHELTDQCIKDFNYRLNLDL